MLVLEQLGHDPLGHVLLGDQLREFGREADFLHGRQLVLVGQPRHLEHQHPIAKLHTAPVRRLPRMPAPRRRPIDP
jgi:hypothetical protein